MAVTNNGGRSVFEAILDASGMLAGARQADRALKDVERAAERTSRKTQDTFGPSEKASRSFGQRLGGVIQGIDRVGERAERTGKRLSLGLTTPLALMGGIALKTFIDFDTAIVKTGANAGATAEQMDALRGKAMKLGADTKFSAEEAANAMFELSTAGVSVTDILDGAADSVVLLAQATGSDLAQSAALVSQAMNAFGIEAEHTGHVADVLTQAANSSAIDINGLAEALASAGQLGASANQSLESVVATVSTLVSQGVPAAQAGTAVSQAIASLRAPATVKARDLVEDLGLQFRDANGHMKQAPDLIRELERGLSSANPAFVEMSGAGMSLNEALEIQRGTVQNLQQDLDELISSGASPDKIAKKQNDLAKATRDLTDTEINGRPSAEALNRIYRDRALDTLLGVEGMKAMNLAMNGTLELETKTADGAAQLNKMAKGLEQTMGKDAANAFIQAHMQGDKFVATGADAVEALAAMNHGAEGTAQTFSDKLAESTGFKLEELTGSLETLAIKIVGKVAPALNDLIPKVTKFLNKLGELADANPGLAKLAVGLGVMAALLGPMLIVLGKVAQGFSAISNGAKGAARATKVLSRATQRVALGPRALETVLDADGNPTDEQRRTGRRQGRRATRAASRAVRAAGRGVGRGAGAVARTATRGAGRAVFGAVGEDGARQGRALTRGLGRAASRVGSELRSLGAAAKEAGRAVKEGLGIMARGVGRGVVKGVQGIGRGFQAAGRAAASAARGVGRFAAQSARAAGKGAVRGVQALGRGMVTAGRGAVRAAGQMARLAVQVARVAAARLVSGIVALGRGFLTLGRAAVQAMMMIGRAMLANPWILVIMAVIVAIILLVKNWDTVKGWLIAVWNAIKVAAVAVWGAIVGVFRTVWGWIRSIFDAAVKWLKFLWQFTLLGFLITHWETIWNAIVTVIRTVWGWIQSVISAGVGFVRSIIETWLFWVRTVWGAVWNFVWSILQGVWDRVRGAVKTGVDLVQGVIQGFIDTVRRIWDGLWNGLKDGLGGIWDGIKSAIQTGANAVIGLLNRLIRGVNSILEHLPGDISIPEVPELRLRKGGLVPGRGRGDKVPARLEPGEFVVNRAAVKRYGLGTLEKMNRGGLNQRREGDYDAGTGESLWDKTGGRVVDAVTEGFDIVQDVAGNVLDAAAAVARWGALKVYEPIERIAQEALDHLPGGGTAFGEMVKGGGKKILETMRSFITGKDAEASTASAGARTPAGRNGLGPAALRLLDAVLAGVPGTVMTSGFRSAARNTAVGGASRSDHTTGHAIDLVGNMARIFAWMVSKAQQFGIKQLIYGHNQFRGGRLAPYEPDDHFDHVHAAVFHRGGLVDAQKREILGLLERGEGVVSARGMDRLVARAKNGDPRGGVSVVINNPKPEKAPDQMERSVRKLQHGGVL